MRHFTRHYQTRSPYPFALASVLRLGAAMAVCAMMLAPGNVQAQWTFGVRGGLNMTPNALQFGAHAQRWIDAVSLPGLGRLGFEPSVEIGLGSEGGGDYTTIRVNGNVLLPFAVGSNEGVRIHPLAGIGYNRFSVSDCPVSFCSFSNFGLNLGGGVTFKERFGVDAYLGLGGIGDFAIMGKLNFGG